MRPERIRSAQQRLNHRALDVLERVAEAVELVGVNPRPRPISRQGTSPAFLGGPLKDPELVAKAEGTHAARIVYVEQEVERVEGSSVP